MARQSGYGICSHSTKKEYIIFSVYTEHRKAKSEVQFHQAHGSGNNYSVLGNEAEHRLMLDDLARNGKWYKEFTGRYNNKPEQSIMIELDTYTELKDTIFKDYEQECVLHLVTHKHGLYKASLIYADDKEESIGYLREVPQAYALAQGNFTYDESAGKFFGVTDSDETCCSSGIMKTLACYG